MIDSNEHESTQMETGKVSREEREGYWRTASNLKFEISKKANENEKIKPN